MDQTIRRGYSHLRGLVIELRPHQWYKQLVLFIPVVFSLNAWDPSAWAVTGAGAVLFTGVAGGVYIFNDILDREEDRDHPEKRHRPIASGDVGVSTGVFVGTLLLVGSMGLAVRLNVLFAFVLLVYLAQNVLYSAKLKEYVYLDVMLIGVGFVLRAVSGVVLLDSPMSPWLILCTFLAALMLGTGKRLGEFHAHEAGTRNSLTAYSEETLEFMFTTVSTMTLAAYSLYTVSASSNLMMVTIPFGFYAVFRYRQLVETGFGEQPIDILTERGMVTNFVVWGLAVFLVLYLIPHVEVTP